MSAAAAVDARASGVPWRAMFAAELLKLRKRRGLFWSTLLLLVGPVVLGYFVLTLAHALNPERAGPPGGRANLRDTYEFLAQVGIVAAMMAGVTVGGADLSAGVFRELVVTGRSRLALFGVRFPGAVLFLAPFVAAAVVIASVSSLALPGDGPDPSAVLLIEYAAWLALALATGLALGLGIGSLLSGRVGVGLVLAWQFVTSPILLATGKVDPFLVAAALRSIEPESLDRPLAPAAAALTIAVWMIVPLAVGAWRTATRDA